MLISHPHGFDLPEHPLAPVKLPRKIKKLYKKNLKKQKERIYELYRMTHKLDIKQFTASHIYVKQEAEEEV